MFGESKQWREPLPPGNREHGGLGQDVTSAEDEASTLEPQAKRLLKAWLEKMQAKRKAKQALAAAAKKEGSI